ncbi:winged helix-turn-helix transcriptional regulator [Actinomadura roseirufa]|uniref:winged helix-turn-helix transcriptional regulator n=1 Tax=Actinomadura roseirufa TaxID=2094049 RepID=UPI001041AE84|nr:helix-turn-helix domain-containing protein [Actinomadura roseirufa]
MTRTDFAGIACSIARSAAIVGDPWALLIMRDVALGLHRFDELQRDLGVATNVLSRRLERLVRDGLLLRELYSRRPDRYEYRLTEKGRDLVPVLLALTAWGDRWEAGDAGPPLTVRHRACGHDTQAAVTCRSCHGELTSDEVEYLPGPGGRAGPGTALIPTIFAGQTSAPSDPHDDESG